MSLGYDEQGSRFSVGSAADRRGSFARFLQNDGGGLSQFVGGMQGAFRPPQSTGEAEREALSEQSTARNDAAFNDNLGRVQDQFGQYAQLGFNSVSQAQAVTQAKEMAKLQAQSANQGAMFSAIGSGLSALGSIGSFGISKGWFGGGGSSSSLPSTFGAKSSLYGSRAFSSSSPIFGSGGSLFG